MQLKRPKIKAYFSILAGVFILYPSIAWAEDNSTTYLISPFRDARPLSKKFEAEKCRDSGLAAPRQLIFGSRYEDDDRTRSIVNDAQEQQYQILIRPLRKMEAVVTAHANDYVRGRTGAGACTAELLAAWARENALLNIPVNDQGQMVRAWVLASFGSAWSQVRGAHDIPQNKRSDIDQWLQRVSNVVQDDFRPGQKPQGKNNNHTYWANWAVAITATALQNQSDFAASYKRYQEFVRDIQDDGSLAHERTRGARALYYHVFAAGPLYLQTELFRRNQMVRGVEIKAMDRLLALISAGIVNPNEFQQRTGLTYRQDMSFMESTTPDILKLAICRAPENSTYRDAYSAYRKANPEPGSYIRLGGDLSLLKTCVSKTAKTALNVYSLK